MKKIIFMLAMIVLAGCSLPISLAPSAPPTPTLYVPSPLPTATQIPPTDTPLPPTATPEPVVLDLCTLVTSEEAEAIIGSPVEVQPYQELGNCSYVYQPDLTTLKQLVVGASSGDEAKTLLLSGVGMAVAITGDEAAMNVLQDMQENIDTLTIKEMVDLMLVFFEAYANVTPLPDLADGGFWIWNDDIGGGRSFGQIILVRGDAYVNIGLIGLEEESVAFEEAESLVPVVLERLPPAFTIITE